MSNKKLAATALLTLAFLSMAGAAAIAEDNASNDDSTSFVAPTGRPTDPAPFERRNHGDHKGHHGDDGQFQVAVPPMVITPNTDSDDKQQTGSKTGAAGSKQSFKVAPPKTGSSAKTTVPDTAGKETVIEPNTSAFDPNANKPIQMNLVHPTNKTPADVFMQSAQIGVGVMAAGAAVLGITAAVRGSRSRREVKTDFLYEVEN